MKCGGGESREIDKTTLEIVNKASFELDMRLSETHFPLIDRDHVSNISQNSFSVTLSTCQDSRKAIIDFS